MERQNSHTISSLAGLIAQLLDLPNRADSEQNTALVDICARSTEFLMDASFCSLCTRYISISLSKPKGPNTIGNRTDLSSGASAPLFGNADAGRYVSIIGDIFANAPKQLDRVLNAVASEEAPTPAFYCFPPSGKTSNDSFGNADAAASHSEQFLESIGQAANPAPILEPEWFFIFALGELVQHYQSRAVVRIDARLLSLARAGAHRSALAKSGLLEEVILLPQALSEKRQDTLLVLSSQAKATLLTDMSAGLHSCAASEIIKLYYEAKEHAQTLNLQHAEQMNWNLSPQFQRLAAVHVEHTIPLGKLAKISRGATKQTLNSFPAGSESKVYTISAKTFKSGELIDTQTVVERTSPDAAIETQLGPNDIGKKFPVLVGAAIILGRAAAPSFPVALYLPVSSDSYLSGKYYDFNAMQEFNDAEPCPEDFEIPSDAPETPGLEIFEAQPRCIAAENLFVIEPARFEDRDYLFAFLYSELGQELLAQTAHGNVISQLSTRDLKQLPVPYPSEEKRLEIVRSFMEKQAERRGLEQQLAELDRERKALFSSIAG